MSNQNIHQFGRIISSVHKQLRRDKRKQPAVRPRAQSGVTEVPRTTEFMFQSTYEFTEENSKTNNSRKDNLVGNDLNQQKRRSLEIQINVTQQKKQRCASKVDVLETEGLFGRRSFKNWERPVSKTPKIDEEAHGPAPQQLYQHVPKKIMKPLVIKKGLVGKMRSLPANLKSDLAHRLQLQKQDKTPGKVYFDQKGQEKIYIAADQFDILNDKYQKSEDRSINNQIVKINTKHNQFAKLNFFQLGKEVKLPKHRSARNRALNFPPTLAKKLTQSAKKVPVSRFAKANQSNVNIKIAAGQIITNNIPLKQKDMRS